MIALTIARVSAPSRADAEPATAEATAWLGVGGGLRQSVSGYPLLAPQLRQGPRALGFAELDFGGEISFQLGTFGGRYDAYEFRSGMFIDSAVSDHAVLGELGASLLFTQVEHAQFGTFDIRAGGGAGLYDDVLVPHAVVTLSGGVRSFRCRYREGRKAIAFGSVLRLFLTTRVRPTLEYPLEAVFGVEVEPSFLLPPWSWMKLAGARPD